MRCLFSIPLPTLVACLIIKRDCLELTSEESLTMKANYAREMARAVNSAQFKKKRLLEAKKQAPKVEEKEKVRIMSIVGKLSSDEKLDLIISRLNNMDQNIKKINARITEFDEKLDRVSIRLDTLEKNFQTKCQQIDNLQESKVDIESLDDLTAKLAHLEEFKLNYEKNKIMQESYDKRLNVLIHGIKEDYDNVWEKREKPLKNLIIL